MTPSTRLFTLLLCLLPPWQTACAQPSAQEFRRQTLQWRDRIETLLARHPSQGELRSSLRDWLNDQSGSLSALPAAKRDP